MGRDTLTLLFDTGGGATIITPAVAERIGCRLHGRDVGHRMTGEEVVFQRCDSVTIELAGRSRPIAPIAVYDVNALLPAELPRLDGVLALDAFRGQVVTLDWTQNRVLVRASAPTAKEFAPPLRLATGESGRMLTAFLRIEGRRGPLWLLLDSGNLRGLLVARHIVTDSEMVMTGDSVATLEVTGLPPARLPFAGADLIIDGALGTDFLRRGAITLDLRHTDPP